jgi:hypothetical protein
MTHVRICATFCLVWFVAVQVSTAEEKWTFETGKVGALPENWKEAKTGKGPGSVWKVVADESAPSGSKALAQVSSEGPRPLFNLCIAGNSTCRDIDVSVSLKALCGVIDQGGGPVWRFQDENNYYIARANPLESNYRVYKVVDGKRIQIDSADVQVPAGCWTCLRVVHKGDEIRCYLNDKVLLKVTDTAIRKEGRVGLWTKADAVTLFDDLCVVETADAQSSRPRATGSVFLPQGPSQKDYPISTICCR